MEQTAKYELTSILFDNAPARHVISPLFLIHILTAFGAACGLFAMLSAAAGNWAGSFMWLGVALIVDGIDGPIARHFRVAERLPRWNGSALDFVVDFTNYVFVPAWILALGCGLSPHTGAVAGAVVAITGAIYFGDNQMKQSDNTFRGFPAVWNMPIFVIFVMTPPPPVTVAMVIVLAILTFSPVRFVHPIRVVAWRPVTLAVFALWTVAALWLISTDFAPAAGVRWLLVVASLYLFCSAGIRQYVLAPDRRRA